MGGYGRLSDEDIQAENWTRLKRVSHAAIRAAGNRKGKSRSWDMTAR